MTKYYFITGTDTACGKTYVSCCLLDYFKRQNRKAVAIKPVASGVFLQKGREVNEDLLQLEQHNGRDDLLLCPWLLKEPIAPHIAADHEGQILSAQAIVDFCHDPRFAEFDTVLVEGAGGLMVPLNAHETWLDVLRISQMPVILVVGMRLGCINHSLLSAAALLQQGIACAGWVANCLDPAMLTLEENIQTLVNRMPWPLLTRIGYLTTAEQMETIEMIAG